MRFFKTYSIFFCRYLQRVKNDRGPRRHSHDPRGGQGETLRAGKVSTYTTYGNKNFKTGYSVHTNSCYKSLLRTVVCLCLSIKSDNNNTLKICMA